MRSTMLADQLPFTLKETNFPTLGSKYEGKVRDTYRSGNRLVLITTDRLSAFDRVLTTLPFKGDILNQLAHFWFKKTAHIVPNHVLDMPDPCVIVGRAAQPFAIEFVVRAHLTGSLWRDYSAGKDPYQLRLPPGLKKDCAFDKPMLTPSTKAPKGEHDTPLSEDDVLAQGLVSSRNWARAKEAALAVFAEGQKHARAQGLILVDTKYEFGLIDDELVIIDEMHTPDSSRFWKLEGSKERFERGEAQVMLDKENLRQWLITERNFQGHGAAPVIPDDVRISLTEKYLAAYEQIVGAPCPLTVGSTTERLAANLKRAKLL